MNKGANIIKPSIFRRLDALEHRPQNAIPQFTVEYSDGHREHWRGMDIMGHISGRDNVKRIFYDGEHQPSVDGAALLKAIYPQIELLPTF